MKYTIFKKIALDIGIMEPTVFVEILKLKMHIRNKQKGGNTMQMIKVNKVLQ